MIHLDRELHKLNIALGCEAKNESVALFCASGSTYSVVRLAGAEAEVLGTGATGTEAIGSARLYVDRQRDERRRRRPA